MSDVFCVEITSGEVRRVTRGQIDVWGLDWLPEREQIVFSSFTGGPYGLSVVPAAGGTIRRIPVLSEWVRYPTVALETGRLVFEGRRETQDIMKTSIGPGDAGSSSPEPLVVSNRLDNEPALSPDGRQLAFVSTRTGSRELWLCGADGSHPTQLTSIGGEYVSRPVWSANGRRLAFSITGVEAAVYVIETAGGAPRRITPRGQNAMPCSWSADDARVYYAGETAGEWQVWCVDPGGGNAERMTQDGGIAAFESPDGTFLYYMRPDVNGIWRRPIEGGDAGLVIPRMKASFFRFWSVADAGIYYATPEEFRSPVFLERWTGADPVELARIPSYPSAQFSVAPDGNALVFVRSSFLDIDLFLVGNIRL
jgi:Tol biopolymer transport system component